MKKLTQLLLVLLTPFCAASLNAEIIKILIQGDTQEIMDPNNGKQDNFVPFMAKVLTDPVTRDADFILQMGDIVESDNDNSDRPRQYQVAREGWRQIDGAIPYVLNLGNNDDAEEYFAAFDDLDPPLASTTDGTNFAYSLNAGGIDWLIISVRYGYGKSNKEKDWIDKLVKDHPHKKVILIKHEVNVDSGVVNRLKKNPNLVLVLSGHTWSQKELLVGDQGNKIGWIRTCHHDENLDSYFRILLIDTVRGTVSSRFYSPQYEKYWHDPTAPYHDFEKSAPWTFEGFDFGVSESPSALAEKNAQFVSLENVPYSVLANDTFKVVATVENTGTTQWTANLQKNNYNLGSENPRDNQTWGTGTHRTRISRDVLSGERHEFEIDCIAPAQEGFYNFQVRMVQDGVQWFGDYSENRVIYVSSNQVASSSFEDDATRSAAWSLGSQAGWTSRDKLSGDSSLCMSGSSTATRQTVALKKNTHYEISVWFKNGEATTGTVFFDTKDTFDGPGEGQFKIYPQEVNQWTRFVGSFNSGELDSVTIRLFSNNLDGKVYFDDVLIRPKAPEKTDFAYQDVEYSYTMNVTDFNSDSLEYGYYSKPGWLNFDFETGILSGTPDSNDMGIHSVTLYTRDDKKEETVSFAVRVLEESPFTRWNEIHAINGGITKNDKDKDGMIDFLEFALGGDPNKNDATDKLPKLLRDDDTFNFIFRRNQATLTYTLKESTDLVNWLDHTIVSDQNGFVGDMCTISVPASEEKKFLKLDISQ